MLAWRQGRFRKPMYQQGSRKRTNNWLLYTGHRDGCWHYRRCSGGLLVRRGHPGALICHKPKKPRGRFKMLSYHACTSSRHSYATGRGDLGLDFKSLSYFNVAHMFISVCAWWRKGKKEEERGREREGLKAARDVGCMSSSW